MTAVWYCVYVEVAVAWNETHRKKKMKNKSIPCGIQIGTTGQQNICLIIIVCISHVDRVWVGLPANFVDTQTPFLCIHFFVVYRWDMGTKPRQ